MATQRAVIWGATALALPLPVPTRARAASSMRPALSPSHAIHAAMSAPMAPSGS